MKTTLVLFLAAMFFGACVVVKSPPCNASTCTGCCDATGVCQAGTNNAACGSLGAACQVCGQNQGCQSNQCILLGQGGGAGGGGGGGLAPGDVTFLWSFSGGTGTTCADNPGVAWVVIKIPGQVLANNGRYPCRTNGVDGIVLTQFIGGTYNFVVEADDAANRPLSSVSGNFTVNGNVTVQVSLAGAGNSRAQLHWKFPPNSSTGGLPATCAQAGAAFVDVYYDGDTTTPDHFNCSDGETASGALTRLLLAGQHSVVLIGRDQNLYALYRLDGTLTTSASGTVSVNYTFGWAVGGAAIGWTLTNGSTTETCASSGVTTMAVNFKGSTGNLVYGTTGDPQACTASPVVYSFLQPDTYQVLIAGSGNGVSYLSNQVSPPTILVQAGVFPGPSQALNVTMYKQ